MLQHSPAQTVEKEGQSLFFCENTLNAHSLEGNMRPVILDVSLIHACIHTFESQSINQSNQSTYSLYVGVVCQEVAHVFVVYVHIRHTHIHNAVCNLSNLLEYLQTRTNVSKFHNTQKAR